MVKPVYTIALLVVIGIALYIGHHIAVDRAFERGRKAALTTARLDSLKAVEEERIAQAVRIQTRIDTVTKYIRLYDERSTEMGWADSAAVDSARLASISARVDSILGGR